MSLLQPCPYCQDEHPYLTFHALGQFYAHCPGCRASGPVLPSAQQAFEAWNALKPDPASPTPATRQRIRA